MSGVLQGFAQIKEGQIAAAQGKLDNKIAQRNQQALNRQAKAEKEAAAIDEQRISRRGKIVQAKLQVGQSKSGIGLAGATLNALTDAAFQFSMDRNLTLRRGLVRSRELIQRGKIISAQGKFAQTIGKERRTASFLRAGASFASVFDGGSVGGTTPTGPTGSSSVGDFNTGTTTSGGRTFA